MEATGSQDYIMVAVFFLFGLAALWLGFHRLRQSRLLSGTARADLGTRPEGLVEVEGRAEELDGERVKAPFSRTDCLFYSFEIESYRRSSSGGSGGSSRARWEKASSGQRGVPFLVDDGTGAARIDLEKAEIHLRHRQSYYKESEGMLGGLKAIGKLAKNLQGWDGKDPHALFDVEAEGLQPLSERTGIQRVREGDSRLHESYILPGDPLFVLGTAEACEEAPGLRLGKGPRGTPFLAGDRKREGVSREVRKLMRISFVFGAIFVLAAVAMLLQILGVIPQA
jgi:hypothetical protein